MKLADHVDSLRELIEGAFDKHFSRLGLGKTKQTDNEKLPAEVKEKRQRFAEMLESHIGETGSYQGARDKLIDELTFTLFNRLAAIKVMEAANLFPPVLTKQTEHGDRSFGHKAWLEMRPDMRDAELEGIRDYLKSAFDELGQTLPLYSKSYPYALLPDAVGLNDIIDAFNAVEQDAQVGNDIWHSDDVLGWLYESYNNKKKQAHKDSKDKTEYDKVSLQSQVYTPRWVVQFLVENSLGKLYLEMYPNSEIKQRYKIANAPQTQTREFKPLHEVSIIDPACGSGNFLLYAFDFFYELYIDQIENFDADYEKKDIPKLIIENNLHGIDLDDRAVQLAQLGLFIKAKKKLRTIGELNFKVVSSDFYLPEYAEVSHIFEQENGLEKNQKDLIEKIWNDLKYAYKFGALVRLDETLNAQLLQIEKRDEDDLFSAVELSEHQNFTTVFLENLKTAVETYAKAEGNSFLTSKARDAIVFLELLTTQYDVAAANPPYTDSADFGPDLKEFIEDNYKKPYKFNTNLYATFIKRCCELTKVDGKVAMVHPQTFMYIKTFEDVRKYIIDKMSIDIFVEWGYLGMFHPSARVDSVMYVLDKMQQNSRFTFIKLNHVYEGQRYEAFEDAYGGLLAGTKHSNNYSILASKLKIINTWPFIYWISDEFRDKFGAHALEEYFHIKNGLQTGNNDKYLRFWWEVAVDIKQSYKEKKWVIYGKGGPFNKWFGNLWVTVNSINTNTSSPSKGYYREGVNFSGTGSKGTSFRFMPKGCIFDNDAPLIFPKKEQNIYYLLGFINTKLVSYIISCLNPTVKTQVGDIKRIPFTLPNKKQEEIVSKLALINVNIKKMLTENSIFELNFTDNQYITQGRIAEFLNYENYLLTQVIVNEAIINECVFDIFDLSHNDKIMVISREGVNIGSLPVIAEAKKAYLAALVETQEFPLDLIKNYIDVLPEMEFTIEEQDAIEIGFPTLYQSNNDLEEFCIRNQVNPINIWYWFKLRGIVPKQRMSSFAKDFLTNLVREILMEDEDGIIPLVLNSGEKILLERVEEKFVEKGFSTAQYSSFDSVLGRPVHEYLNKNFFSELSDRLNLFMYLPKTPFIWHLSSGPEQGFDCYIIIYKWSRDNLLRLRSVYVENRERALMNRQSDLANNDSADAQNEKDRIFKQLKEIEAFKVKIDELLAEGYNPILDDGVGKNIAPLQKKKMIPYEVLNAGQLQKYLNADW